MAKLRITATKKVGKKTYYRVSDGHPLLDSGWIGSRTLAEIRRSIAKRKKR